MRNNSDLLDSPYQNIYIFFLLCLFISIIFKFHNNSEPEKHIDEKPLPCTVTHAIWNMETENLTRSRFVSPCDDGSPRREIELGAQQCPRKWTSERIKSPRRLSHGQTELYNWTCKFGQNSQSHKICNPKRKRRCKGNDSFHELCWFI